MRKKIIFLLFIFIFLFSFLSETKAQTVTPITTLTPISISNNNSLNILVDLLRIIFGNPNLPENQKNSINPSNFSDIYVTPDVNGLIYYSQCNGPYDNLPLPQGGTLCQAGCGPTTVAMIVASYIDKNINPKTIVENYKANNYYLGKMGSKASDAQNILKSYNLKTATIFADNQKITIDQVMNLFGKIIKNYQNAGWTFFSLANFCDNGCGHYFWIIKIDENLDTWAYDPYYGRLLPRPYNEKSRYPFPKYRVIFGVKK